MLGKIWQWVKSLYRQWFWRSKHWLLYGDNLRQQGDLVSANLAYNQAIHWDQNNYSAWRKQAYLLTELEQNEDALKSYEKALRLDGKDQIVWLEKGQLLETLKREKEALKAYNESIKINPNFYEGWFKKGHILLKNKQKEKALDSFENALRINNTDEELKKLVDRLLEEINREKRLEKLQETAKLAYENQDFQQVISLYQQITELKPDDHIAWLRQGIGYVELNQCSQAIYPLNKALEFDKTEAILWYYRGRTLEDLGQYQDALISYNTALKFNHSYYQAWDGRGIVLAELHHEQHAFNSWEQCISFQGKYEPAYLNWGVVFWKLGKPYDALAKFEKATEINSNYYQAWVYQGKCYSFIKQYKKALECWEKAIAIESQSPKYLENRHYEIKDLSVEIVETAMYLYQSLLETMRVYSKQQIDLILRFLDQALAINPHNAKAWWYKAKILKYCLGLSHADRDKERLNFYFKAMQEMNKTDSDYETIYTEHLIVKNSIACDFNQKAQQKMNLGDVNSALEDVNHSIQLLEGVTHYEDALVQSYRLRGHFYNQLKEYEKAIADFNLALALPSDSHYLTYCERGHTYQNENELELALKDYNASLEIKATVEGYNSRGLLLMELNQVEKALEDFNESVTLDGSNPNSHYNRAFALSYLTQYQEALEEFQEASQLYLFEQNMDAYQITLEAIANTKNYL